MSTNYQDGVLSYGAPVLSGGSYAGWWGNQIWFVDDIDGIAGNEGHTPETAKKTIQEAVDAAGQQDTIFLRPREIGIGTYSGHGYYTGNILTKTTQRGLSIIGTGSGGARGIGANVQCAIEPTPGSTLATLMVQSPCVTIENVLVKAITGCVVGGIAADLGAASTFGQAWGLTISNCSFKDFIGTAAYGSIDIDTIHWATIQHCYFRQGGYAIVLGSSGAAIQGTTIRDCDFVGAAGDWDCDIWTGDVKEINITDCRFAHATPSAGSVNIYVYFTGGTGMITNCYFSDSTVTVSHCITLGGTILNSHCYGSDAILDT
jgi:hypothetical protein